MEYKKRRRKDDKDGRPLSKTLSEFCQNTSGHGFHYWVTAGSAVERALWVGVVLAGFTAALILVSDKLGCSLSLHNSKEH